MVWIGVEKFLYKGNVGFLGEMLSKFSKNPYFCFGHHSFKLSNSDFWVN